MSKSASTSSSAAVNTGALFDVEGNIGLTIGYTWGNGGSVFYAVEALIDYSSLNGQSNGLSLSGPLVSEQIVKAGTPIANVLSLLPSFNFGTMPGLPTLPAGVTAGPPHVYLAAGAREQDVSANLGVPSGRGWLVAPEFGIGTLWQLSNNAAFDARVMYVAPAGGFCVNNGAVQGCAGLGQGLFTTLSLLW